MCTKILALIYISAIPLEKRWQNALQYSEELGVKLSNLETQ